MPAEQSTPSKYSYRKLAVAMFVMAGIYTVCCFVSVRLVFGAGQQIIADALQAISHLLIFSATVFCASWAVLGPRSFFVRFLFAAIPCLLVVSAYLIALSFERFRGGEMLLLMLPLAFVSAQLPFWPFRVFGNWQYVQKGSAFGPSINLQDLLTLTLISAIALGGMAAFLRSEVFESNVRKLAVEKATEKVSPAEIEKTALRDLFGRVIAVAMLPAFVLATLSLPVVYLVFRCCRQKAGILLSEIYLLVFALFATPSSKPYDYLYFLFCFGCYGILLCIPIFVVKAHGIELTRPRSSTELNKRSSNKDVDVFDFKDENKSR